MYDLILCVLATTKNNRLPVFNKIGYKSTKYKTKIVYLVDEEDKPDFIKDDWHKSPNYPLSVRFVHYIKNTKDEFRWLMQVDDDSCTDLDKTVELLDYFYDYKDSMMLTGSFNYFLSLPRYSDQEKIIQSCHCYSVEPIIQKIYDKINVEHLPEDLNDYGLAPYINNGWEHSVLSNSAANKIKKYDKLQEFIDGCLEFKPNFGDQVPFALAKIAKVPIANCHFLSPLPTIEEYSAINKNGRFSHIHHVCDYWSDYNNLLNILEQNIVFESPQEVESYLEQHISNSYWFFYSLKCKEILSRFVIKFNENQSISVLDIEYNRNVAYNLESKKWILVETNIILENEQNQKISFSKMKNKLYGVQDGDNVFILSKFDSTDMIYWKHKKNCGISNRI